MLLTKKIDKTKIEKITNDFQFMIKEGKELSNSQGRTVKTS